MKDLIKSLDKGVGLKSEFGKLQGMASAGLPIML